MNRFEDLINQVDAFIRKYYKNLMIKGLLLFILIFALTFLVVVFLEYIGRFSSIVRATLLFAFILTNGFVFIKYIINPLSKLFSFGKRIDRYQAASIIGKFFPDVNDRLLNTLQLNDAMNSNYGNLELLKASVEQNAKKLTVFSFPNAVSYTENKKYFKYLFPLILAFVIIGLLAPTFFSESTERLVKYNQTFIPEAPFKFELLNSDLIIEEGESMTISAKITPNEGGELPEKVYIESSDGRFLMKKSSKNEVSFTFEKVKSTVDFNFYANGFKSLPYSIKTVGKSTVGKLSAKLIFPSYLSIPTQTIQNTGDLVVPEGTVVEWNGIVKNTKQLKIGTKDSLHVFNETGFRFTKKFKSPEKLQLILFNNQTDKIDTTVYTVDVIKDAYPSIKVNETIDSLDTKKINLTGVASDDHGLSTVVFTYEIISKDGNKIKKSKQVPGIVGTQSRFNMFFDINRLSLQLEDKVNYYFTVYDNDGVNGSKSTTSNVYTFKTPSSSELNEQRKEEKDKSKDELNQLINESKEFNDQLDRLKMELLNTSNPSWQELQQLEQLQKQRESLENRIKNLKDDMKKSFENKNQLSPMDEEMLEKQLLIEDMMDQMMDEELQEMLDKLQEMLEKQNLDGIQDLFEEAETSAEDMNKQLDRTMEMLKRMDVEERIEDLENNLEQLAEEQLKLKEDIEEGNIDKEEAKTKQNELKEEFDKLQEELDEMLSKNEDLKRPFDMDDLESDREEVESEMQEAQENLENNKEKNAGENQKNASDKMQEMSSKLNSMKAQSKQDQQTEDMAALRRLLQNLLRLSFSQETTLEAVNETSINNPSFISLGREQRSIIDNTKPVEDSLIALADRLPEISTFINKELSIINKNFRNMIDDIDERRKQPLLVKQQFVMTSFNNLALFLNEALENMQDDMQGNMSGSGSCDNPGGKGKGSEGDDMQNMKEMLKKQLEEMEKGNQPGGKEPGDKQGVSVPMNSQQAAKMAAQQSEMRKKIEQLKKEMQQGKEGDNGDGFNELLKELEEQEKNLVNKKWDDELIERQKEILTRLLESEKAMEERGFDEERESISGKDEDFSNQIEFLEYNKQKDKQIELLRTLDPAFSKYYRNRANDYFNIIY